MDDSNVMARNEVDNLVDDYDPEQGNIINSNAQRQPSQKVANPDLVKCNIPCCLMIIDLKNQMQQNDAMNSLSYSKLVKYIEKAHPR